MLDTAPQCLLPASPPAVPPSWDEAAEAVVVRMTLARAKIRDIVAAVCKLRPNTSKNSVISKRMQLRAKGVLDDSTKFNSEDKPRRKSCDYEELERMARRKKDPMYYDGQFSIHRDHRHGVATRADNSCRWPYGDPGKPSFHFCCFPKIRGRPYCFAHNERATRPDDSQEGR